MYVVDFSGDDADRQAREQARAAERTRLRERYARWLIDAAGVDKSTAERIMSVLFDDQARTEDRCECGCHPRLSTAHDDGFDCPCTWDEQRRAASWTALWEGPEVDELRAEHDAEERSVADWIAGQVSVEATRTSSYAPEQWAGTVDGHPFYFHERHGEWRIELDLEPCGRFANKVLEVRDGEFVTEPEPILEGEVIARGVGYQLGASPVEHLAFIVRTIRDHLWGRQCDHAGALFYCPSCGQRMAAPP